MADSKGHDERVREIQEQLNGPDNLIPYLVSPKRQLIREGKLQKVQLRLGVKKTRRVFLFNDLLLWTTKQYHIRGRLDLAAAQIVKRDSDVEFEIIHPQRASSLIFTAPDAETAERWYRDLAETTLGAITSEAESLLSSMKGKKKTPPPIRKSRSEEAILSVPVKEAVVATKPKFLKTSDGIGQTEEEKRKKAHKRRKSKGRENEDVPSLDVEKLGKKEEEEEEVGDENRSKGVSFGEDRVRHITPRKKTPRNKRQETTSSSSSESDDIDLSRSDPRGLSTLLHSKEKMKADRVKARENRRARKAASEAKNGPDKRSSSVGTSETYHQFSETITRSKSAVVLGRVPEEAVPGQPGAPSPSNASSNPSANPSSNPSPNAVAIAASIVADSKANSAAAAAAAAGGGGSSEPVGKGRSSVIVEEAEQVEEEGEDVKEVSAQYAEVLAALEGITSLSRNDISLLKRMRNPTVAVKLIIEAAGIVLGVKPARIERGRDMGAIDYWKPARALLLKPHFLRLVAGHTERQLKTSTEGMHALRAYITNPLLDQAHIQRISTAAAKLWVWVQATYALQVGRPIEEIKKREQFRKTKSRVINKTRGQRSATDRPGSASAAADVSQKQSGNGVGGKDRPRSRARTPTKKKEGPGSRRPSSMNTQPGLASAPPHPVRRATGPGRSRSKPRETVGGDRSPAAGSRGATSRSKSMHRSAVRPSRASSSNASSAQAATKERGRDRSSKPTGPSRSRQNRASTADSVGGGLHRRQASDPDQLRLTSSKLSMDSMDSYTSQKAVKEVIPDKREKGGRYDTYGSVSSTTATSIPMSGSYAEMLLERLQLKDSKFDFDEDMVEEYYDSYSYHPSDQMSLGQATLTQADLELTDLKNQLSELQTLKEELSGISRGGSAAPRRKNNKYGYARK